MDKDWWIQVDQILQLHHETSLFHLLIYFQTADISWAHLYQLNLFKSLSICCILTKLLSGGGSGCHWQIIPWIVSGFFCFLSDLGHVSILCWGGWKNIPTTLTHFLHGPMCLRPSFQDHASFYIAWTNISDCWSLRTPAWPQLLTLQWQSACFTVNFNFKLFIISALLLHNHFHLPRTLLSGSSYIL